MNFAQIFGLPAALLILAVAANRLSRLTRVPDLIVLLALGVGLGPVLHWVNPDHFQTTIRVLGELALILILFEGGLELRLREAIRHFPSGVLLAFVSYGLTLGAVTGVAHWTLHLPVDDSLLLGAAFACSSGTVIIPALQQIDVPEGIRVTLTVESSLGEIIAVLVVGGLLGADTSESIVSGLAIDFTRHVLIGVLLGVAVGFVWSRLWPLVSGQRLGNILNLAVVLGVFSVGRLVGGSGLLAELVFGLTLANLLRTPQTIRHEARILAFHSELSFLVRSFFFVLLGIMAQFTGRQYILPTLAIIAVIFLARYLAVWMTRWSVRDVTRSDTDLLTWILPRGLITAVLALQLVNARGAAFNFVPSMAFAIVLATNLALIYSAVKAQHNVGLSGIPELTVATSMDKPMAEADSASYAEKSASNSA